VDEWVHGWIAIEVVCDVYLKAFMLGDGRCECMKDIRECWEGFVAEF